MFTRKIKSLLAVALAGTMILLASCGNSTEKNSDSQAVSKRIGSVALRVNPEISVAYNDEGNVTAIEGRNEDGREIAKSYKDYIGKSTTNVMADLVKLIDAEGYLIEETEMNKQNLIIELESKSIMPNQNFDRTARRGGRCVKGIESFKWCYAD